MPYEQLTQIQSRIIIGIKQTLKAMENNEVSEVFIALDADKHLTEKVVNFADERGITCHQVDSMNKLGRACGIEVGTSAIAVKSE